MTARNLKTVVTIGGTIAASLPTSAKRAGQELNRLTVIQKEEVAEARRLKTELSGLTKGTDQYRSTAAQLRGVQERINLRVPDIDKAGEASRSTSKGLAGMLGNLKSLHPAALATAGSLGLIAGAGLAVHTAIAGTAREGTELANTVALTGANLEKYQQLGFIYQTLTGDAEQAAAAAKEFANIIPTIEEALARDPKKLEGIQLGLSRLGINFDDFRKLDVLAAHEQLIEGLRGEPLGLQRDVLGLLGISGDNRALLIRFAEDIDKYGAATKEAASIGLISEKDLEDLYQYQLQTVKATRLVEDFKRRASITIGGFFNEAIIEGSEKSFSDFARDPSNTLGEVLGKGLLNRLGMDHDALKAENFLEDGVDDVRNVLRRGTINALGSLGSAFQTSLFDNEIQKLERMLPETTGGTPGFQFRPTPSGTVETTGGTPGFQFRPTPSGTVEPSTGPVAQDGPRSVQQTNHITLQGVTNLDEAMFRIREELTFQAHALVP